MAESIVGSPQDSFEIVRDEVVVRGPLSYHRILVRTPWLTGATNLAELLRAAFGERLIDGTVFICEKAAIVATGRAVPADTIDVGRAARLLARYVRPVPNDPALSIPEKMQYAINQVGWPRILLACVAAAVTRPFPIHGAFYAVAGREARDLDGMYPPYEGTLLPPLTPHVANRLVDRLAGELGTPVAIVDINNVGGRVRAVSPGGLTEKQLFEALSDNPMGFSHIGEQTPIGLVRVL